MTTTGQGGFGAPGFGAAVYTTEREILWGRDDAHLPLLMKSSMIDGALRDAGNSPTTVIRRGLILGRVTSTLEQKEWVATNTDGTQNISSVLNIELRAQDFNANNVDRCFGTLLRAPVIANKLLIQGVNLVGHVDEFLARRQMVSMGFVFDDDPQGFLAGLPQRAEVVTGTSDTLTTAQNGETKFYSSASAVTVTLPTIQAGLSYDLVRIGDNDFTIASAEGDNIVTGNDAAADSIAFTTASKKIGARVKVTGMYNGSTLIWLMEVVNTPYSVGNTGALPYALAT